MVRKSLAYLLTVVFYVKIEKGYKHMIIHALFPTKLHVHCMIVPPLSAHRELISLPEHISRHPHVLEFFKARPSDQKEGYPPHHKITTLYGQQTYHLL